MSAYELSINAVAWDDKDPFDIVKEINNAMYKAFVDRGITPMVLRIPKLQLDIIQHRTISNCPSLPIADYVRRNNISDVPIKFVAI